MPYRVMCLQSRSFPTEIEMRKINSIEVIIPVLTLILGFLPEMILSIYLNAFWIGSSVDFPFMAVPTIFFGDIVFLPIFNLLAYKAIRQSWQYFHRKLDLGLILSIASIISMLLSFYIHYSWLQDSYTGFMDVERGKLSIAGWWHLSFAIVEMTVVMLTVIFWFSAIRNSDLEYIHDSYLKAWSVFIAFTLLNLADLVFRHLFIATTNKNTLELIITQLPSFTTTIFALSVLIAITILHNLSKKDQGLS
jgi:hypothetical protein